ncbi:hypothetical protein Tco_0598686 [Tanacetum coccineum]
MAGPLDTSFRRSVRGGVEQQEFSDLSSLVFNSVVLSTSNDRWYFSLLAVGNLDVKGYCLAIDDLEVLHRVSCRWWEIDFQLWRSFSEWDEWFSSIRLPGSVKGFLEGVFYVAWWFIWGFRNRSTFDVNKPSRSILFENIVSSSFLWCNSRCSRKFSRDDWLKNPHLISL